jgi:hypothetical protein
MPKPLVLLAHSPEAGVAAHDIARRLRPLGYRLNRVVASAGRGGLPALERKLAQCQRVIVLSGPSSKENVILRDLTARARAAGKLLILRTHTGQSRIVRDRLAPARRGVADQRRWRALLKAPASEAAISRARLDPAGRSTSRRGAWLATLALLSVAGAAAYLTDPGFAANVDALRQEATGQATLLLSGIVG